MGELGVGDGEAVEDVVEEVGCLGDGGVVVLGCLLLFLFLLEQEFYDEYDPIVRQIHIILSPRVPINPNPNIHTFPQTKLHPLLPHPLLLPIYPHLNHTINSQYHNRKLPRTIIMLITIHKFL